MKENSGQDRKQKIRDKYKGTDASEIEIIPAKPTADFMESGGIRRVAAYVRVSTDNDEQTSSYELQKNYYTEYITGHPGWELVGIYADEGISGTSIAHRKGMLQMIEDCKAGKIDLIMTKSIARFARNIVDCLSVIDLLKNLEPPVGVQFEADNIYTLDNNGRMILTILASVAEEESHSKSVIMNWSIERRFRKGLFLTPELLGYDRDEDGDLIVNEDEAETVKAIYYLYLNGVSFFDIAEYQMNMELANQQTMEMENPQVLELSAEQMSEREQRRTEIEQTFDYDGYQVARRELFAHLRDPAIIIRKDSITFNTACIAGLEDVVYVNIMFNSDLKRLVVKGCNENDRDALRWCIAKPDKRKSRKMSCRLFSELLYKEMDWSGDCRYKILGYRIEFEGEALYVFDLVAAEVFHECKKKQSADQQPTTVAEENTEEQPSNPRKGYYPDDIAGTFGMPVEQHRQESELRQMDGFVSVGMLTGMPGQQQNL